MTGPTPPTSDDELLSAVLDGEATEGEIARVRSDPALQARLEQLTAISDAVGVATPPPAGLVDQAVDAALEHLATTGAGVVAPPVDELSARRAARSRRFGPLLAAAAVVVLVALGAVAIRGLDDSDSSTDTAAASLDAADDADPAETAAEEFAENESGAADASAEPAADQPAADQPAADADPGTRSAETIDAADAAEFEGQVRTELEQRSETSIPATGAPVPSSERPGSPEPSAEFDVDCAAPGALVGLPGPTMLSGSGRLGGEPVSYAVIDAPDGPVLVIVDAACGVIAEIVL